MVEGSSVAFNWYPSTKCYNSTIFNFGSNTLQRASATLKPSSMTALHSKFQKPSFNYVGHALSKSVRFGRHFQVLFKQSMVKRHTYNKKRAKNVNTKGLFQIKLICFIHLKMSQNVNKCNKTFYLIDSKCILLSASYSTVNHPRRLPKLKQQMKINIWVG